MINLHDTTFRDIYQGLQNENPRTMRKLRGRGKIFKGGPAGRDPGRHEYEKALCVQVKHLKQRQVILSDNVIVL